MKMDDIGFTELTRTGDVVTAVGDINIEKMLA